MLLFGLHRTGCNNACQLVTVDVKPLFFFSVLENNDNKFGSAYLLAIW